MRRTRIGVKGRRRREVKVKSGEEQSTEGGEAK